MRTNEKGEVLEARRNNEDWENARKIWASGSVSLPKKMTNDTAHYRTDLTRAAATYLAAKEVTDTDRERNQTTDQIADQCTSLSEALYQLDDIALSRAAGASRVPFLPLVGETLANLALLESALRHANVPALPRKKPQEHNNFLVVVLADTFERNTDQNATVTTNPVTDKREGPFVDFVMSFAKHFLPEEAKSLNPRAIQRALKTRRDKPEPNPQL